MRMADWLQVCPSGPRHRYTDAGLIEREGDGVIRAPTKLAAVQKVISTYGGEIESASARHGFPSHWLAGLIAMESGGNPGAQSSGVGARGLVQMMPATAKGMGLDPERLWEPAYAIEAALLYMDNNVKRYGMDLPVLAGAYNAGSRRCSVTTNCKTSGVSDGTTAVNSWGLIEDCHKGTGSKYVERVVGAANEALLLGYGQGGQYANALSSSGDAILNALAFFTAGAAVAAAVYVTTR